MVAAAARNLDQMILVWWMVFVFLWIVLFMTLDFFVFQKVLVFRRRYKTLYCSTIGDDRIKNKKQIQFQFQLISGKKKNKRPVDEQKRNVFMFWVGKRYEFLEQLRDLARMHGGYGEKYTVHLINHDNIFEYFDEDEYLPDEFFYELIPAHQADYLRVFLIKKYGGIWLDSDTLVMDSMDGLFRNLEEDGKDGIFFLENGRNIMNGVFGSRKETPLMTEWLRRMHKTLYEKTTMNWNEIGSEVLDRMKKENPGLFSQYLIMNGLDTVAPVDWRKCVKEYLKKDYDNYKTLVRDFQPVLVLVNSVYKEKEKETIQGEKSKNKRKCALDYFMERSKLNLNLY